MNTDTIQAVADVKLCCSCGACALVCPRSAISYSETVGGYLLPQIDAKACVRCGLCRSVCPGIGFAPGVTARLPDDPFSGTAIETYVARATDPELYANSQSGGIVSALLADALRTHRIIAAVTTVMAAGNPPKPVARLARNIGDIRQAQKSKYCPVPVLTLLREVERVEGPIAMVGLPCQIHGLCHLCEVLPWLKRKIGFTIGLICAHTLTLVAVDHLLRKARVPAMGENTLHFRDKACGGYPGNVNVISSAGVSVSLPRGARQAIQDLLVPARCRLCFDKMNVLADITVGDPWGISQQDGTDGESVAVVRTEVGREVFQSMLEHGAAVGRPITYRQVLAGQKVEKKRLEWRGYVEAWKDFGYPVPNFSERLKGSTPPRPSGMRFRAHLQQSLSLDQHPSRAEVLAAVQKNLLLQDIKRRVTWPLMVMKRVLGKMTGRLVRKAH